MLYSLYNIKMSEKESPVVTNKMLALGFTAPFIFSIGGMVIAYFATKNLSSKIRSISLIVATFLGLLISIGIIFLMQWYINRKIEQK